MNESLDLRNRINKMRSINNLDANENKGSTNFKIDPKKTDQKETQKNIVHSQKKNTENREIKKFDEINTEFIPPKEDIVNTNALFQKKQIDKNENKNFNNDNEVQFRLLANKFNESVEVILELSKKVNKLEKLIYSEKENNSSRGSPFNFRFISIFFIIFILGYSFSLIDIDTTLIREIIKDLLTGI